MSERPERPERSELYEYAMEMESISRLFVDKGQEFTLYSCLRQVRVPQVHNNTQAGTE